MKQVKKLLAIILTIATLIGIFPCGTSVFAEEYNAYVDEKAYEEQLLTEVVESGDEKAEIIGEVTEKRDEYSKTYKRADGSYTSIVSGVPLHTYEDGQWNEIVDTVEIQEGEITVADEAACMTLNSPSVELPDYDDTIIEDTLILKDSEDSNSQNTNYSNVAEAEIAHTSSYHGEVLVKFNLDILSFLKNPGVVVTDVSYECLGYVIGNNIVAKPVNDSWNSETVTYSDVYTENGGQSITYENKIIDYFTGVPSRNDITGSTININITDLFTQWLNGRANNGFVIMAEDENTTGFLVLAGDRVTGNTNRSHSSYIVVDYVDTSGRNDAFEYLTQEIGRAGTASVNTLSRSLSISRSDLSMSGLRSPVDIAFNYDPASFTWLELMATLLELEGEDFEIPDFYGNNWLPSYSQWISYGATGSDIYFFSGEGAIVCFNEIEETTTENDITTTQTVYEADESSPYGYSLELVDPNGGYDYENIKIVTPDGETVIFNESGIVTEIWETEANSDGSYDKISVFYADENPFKIDYITDGIGRIYDFVYATDSGKLSEIKCLTADGTPIKAGTTTGELMVSYTYNSNGDLKKVAYPDEEIVRYSNENGTIHKVSNIDGYTIEYTYDDLGKVTNISEYVGNTQKTYGNKIALTQLSNRQVKVVDDFSGIETYQFGRDGKLNYTFDDKGNYLKSDYAPAKDENVYSSNEWKIIPQNILVNGSFEETEDGKAENWTNSFNVEDVDTNETVTDYACKVFSAEPTTKLQSQEVFVEGGDAYTFSLFAKTNLTEVSTTDKLYVAITAKNANGSKSLEARSFELTEEFEQYSVTVSKDTEITSVTVEFGFDNAKGDFYVNNAQLEKGLGTAEHNLVENGSFTNNGEYWSDTIIATDSINGKPVNAVKFTGGLPSYNDTVVEDHISATTQNIEINGKKGETYSIGGWFKGSFNDKTTTSQLTNSSAQIKVTYSYTDTVTTTDETTNETTTTEQTITENFVLDFAPNNNGWQYATDTFALKGDTESVDVTVMAKNITEDSYATGINFERDSESEVIEDDEEEIEADEETCTCGCEDCYYGENCPCTGAINNDCQCPECLREETSTQDNFGNTLLNKSTDGIRYIETISQYTSDGNNLSTYTDENGNVITYDYDTLNGVLKAITSPIGTGNETTTTNYSYDDMGKVVSVSTTVNDNENQTLNYSYEKDRLKEITTPNGKYRVKYNDWGQVSSVNVVTVSDNTESIIPLVEYTYNEGINRTQVKTVTYRNSSEKTAFYSYEYYDNGTLEKVFLNDEEIHHIEYDNLGALTSIQNTGGRTVEYTDYGTYIYNPDGVCVYSISNNDDSSVTEENYGVTYTTFAPEDEYNSVTGITTITEKFEINSNNRITQETNTDSFGRTNSQNFSLYNITDESEDNPATLAGEIKTEYGYSVEEDGKTSSSIEKLINKTYNGVSETPWVYDGYFYEYDKQNKISAEKTLNADGTTTDKYSYEYDGLGQLVRYNDAVENKTYTYTYDNNGNILTKSEYGYTLSDTLGTATSTTSFGYEARWKDRLSTVGDKTITYDNIGNPTNYLGATLTWEGRQLKSYENNEKLVTYEYDENGMRYRTTVVDKTKEEKTTANADYVWLGGKLVSMVLSDDETYLSAKYLYNNLGEIIGFKWLNDTAAQSTYYFLKNLQGDITGVVSATGKMQVSYSYDVWGNRTTQCHANTSTAIGLMEYVNQVYISALNPFGYRGYCYDAYTDLYYLQSRYYDPNTGRFINADDTNYLNATGTVLGCNLFAYCENDGVNFVDENGNKKKSKNSSSLLKSDWAGREILWRYLYGGGKERTYDDEKWAKYMMANELLKTHTKYFFNKNYIKFEDVKKTYSKKIDKRISMEIDNGEQIIGYQLLHGTNSDVGDYRIKGKIKYQKNGKIVFDMDYEWNDIIDPNFDYTTDQLKFVFAKTISLGRAKDYTIKIKWSDESVFNKNKQRKRWTKGWLKD